MGYLANGSSDEDNNTMEEENDLQACPLSQRKTHKYGDDQEEIPISQGICYHLISGISSCFKQKGQNGVTSWCYNFGYWGKWYAAWV